MQTYVKELKTLLQQKQDEIRERNKEIEEGRLSGHQRSQASHGRAQTRRSLPRSSISLLSTTSIAEASKAAEGL